jgi:hypothetical protein
MKYYSVSLIGLIVLLSFSACHKTAHENKNTGNRSDSFKTNDTLKLNEPDPKLLEYKTFLNTLDSSNINSATKAAGKFKEIFTNQRASLCDSGYVMFQTLYDTLNLKLNETIQLDSTDFSPLIENEPLPRKLKDLKNQYQKNGFVLTSSEGTIYIVQDRNFIASSFFPIVSETMKNYLIEIQTESQEGFAMDDAISISPQKMIERIIWYEKFISANPNFVFIANCNNYRKAYLTYLLSGYKKTSLYTNNNDKKLTSYFTTAYNYLLQKYPTSETAVVVKPYFDAITQKQFDTVKQLFKSYTIKGYILNLNE